MVGRDRETEDLHRLAMAAGIHWRYFDISGELRTAPDSTIREILKACGLPADDARVAAASLAQLEASIKVRLVPPVLVVRESGSPLTVRLTLPVREGAAVVTWRLLLERGAEQAGAVRLADLEPTDAGGVAGRGVRLVLGPMPETGYHRLQLRLDDGRETETLLAVVPPRAFLPAALGGDRRVWGISVQLYGLRSRRNWGIGDFSDLDELLRAAAGAGAAAVAVNPLHALFRDLPERASPYSPSSRHFVNPLYLDVEAIDDFAECPEARAEVGRPEFVHRLERLRDAALVDYAGVADCKARILPLLYRSFRARHLAHPGDARAADLDDFRRDRGERLRRFAVFECLRERFVTADPSCRDWRRWPEAYRRADSPAIAAFAEAEPESVGYIEYLQWQVDRQLRRCAETARRLDMPIGLYHDLAVGVDPDGAEAWIDAMEMADGVSLGAPPDSWSRSGQKWGLRPVNPIALADSGYASFIALVRANMRHAGALRIDHVLGLARQFWVPLPVSAEAGAYVAFPFDDLLGIVALESQRNRCLVIGEDLGTVPEGLREALAVAGIFSTRLLYFERDAEGRFLAPEGYPVDSVAAIGTHDLPPLSAFWTGDDVRLRARLGLLDDADAALAQRAGERQLLAAALATAGTLPVDADVGEVPVLAIHRYLARAGSRLLVVHFEDLLDVRDPVNVPGTTDEMPNWRRKLPLAVDRLFADRRVGEVVAALNAARPRLAAPGAEVGVIAPPPVPFAT